MVAEGCSGANELSGACDCVAHGAPGACVVPDECDVPAAVLTEPDAHPPADALLGIAGSSLLCSSTHLTAPPLIMLQTRLQGFSD